MNIDPETRVGQRVRQYVAALKVPPAPSLAHLLKPRSRVHARLIPVAAALAVLAIIALTVVRPPTAPVASGQGKPGLPDRFASYSSLTAAVSTSPPGTAIALYQHGVNMGRYDRAQAVVLGAFDDVYRRLDLAENHDGAPTAMLLSPDGTQAAIGSRIESNNVRLVNLATGKADELPAWTGRSDGINPVAWSPDGRYLVVVPQPSARYPNALLYDLTTRAAPTVLSAASTRAAAFSPDGTRLAYQSANGLRVTDLTQNTTVDLPTPPGTPRALQLAWSPDGQLLALTGHERVYLADATGSGKPVPSSFPCDLPLVLTWTGARTILVSHNGFVEINVDSGASRRISQFDESRIWPAETHELGSMSFASNLMVGMQIRPADSWPDRGPWPPRLRLTCSAAAIVLAAAAALLTRRRRRRIRQA